jgi:hypothetical protein
VAEDALVGLVEARPQLGVEVDLRERLVGQGDDDLVPLAVVPEVGLAHEAHVGVGHAGARQGGAALGLELLEDGVDVAQDVGVTGEMKVRDSWNEAGAVRKPSALATPALAGQM